MTKPSTYTCGGCHAEHVSPKEGTPVDWCWCGELLLCGDCQVMASFSFEERGGPAPRVSA